MSFRPKSAMMLKSSGYRWAQFAPHPALARWISVYWTVETGSGEHVVRTLPDACIDLTLRLCPTPRAFVAGVQQRQHQWSIRGRMHLLSARLLPGTASLLGIDASVLPAEWTPLTEFLPTQRVRRLVRDAARAASDPQRVAVLEAFLSNELLNRDLDARLSSALRELFAARGDIAIAALAKRAGAHTRTLSRLFQSGVGLSPKRFARIVRVQSALRELPNPRSWTRIAADLGYHDQAHFIHEVRELFGVTPRELATVEINA